MRIVAASFSGNGVWERWERGSHLGNFMVFSKEKRLKNMQRIQQGCMSVAWGDVWASPTFPLLAEGNQNRRNPA